MDIVIPTKAVNGQKECNECHEWKSLADYYTREKKGKIYYSSKCKSCNKKRSIEWVKKNKDYCKEYRKKYLKEYYENNRQKMYEDRRERMNKNRRELNNLYIKKLLAIKFKMSCKDITPEMIKLKRAQVKKIRILREARRKGLWSLRESLMR